jgi:N-acetylneuraminic acid mutarotase
MAILLKLFAKKTDSALILICLTALSTIAVNPAQGSANSWASKASMHAERGRLGVAAVNGKIYAIGGDAGGIIGSIGQYKHGGTSLVVNTTEEYDPATDTWTFKTPMPTQRDHFGVAVYQNKIYCIGGMTPNGETAVNEVYDPATDMWETKAAMPTPGLSSTANIVNGKIYMIGTIFSGNSQNQVYDPTSDSWTTKTPPPYSIMSAASAVANNKIYVIADNFADVASSSSPPFDSEFVQMYDPETDNWSFPSPAPSAMLTATAAVTSGINTPKRIYFFDETGNYVYDLVNNSWTTGVSMPTARGYAGAAVIDDVIYVVGGVIFPPSDYGEMRPCAVNEQYTPIGYGTQTQPQLIYAAVAIAATATIIVITAMALKKRRKKNY